MPFVAQTTFGSDGTPADCYDGTTGLKLFVDLAALLPPNSAMRVVLKPLSALAGAASIVSVSEAKRTWPLQRQLSGAARSCSCTEVAWPTCSRSAPSSAVPSSTIL